MKFIIIFGPQASGKMTVGYELEKLTGIKLFHNHMTIELVHNFFNFGTSEFDFLVDEYRRLMFEAISKSDLSGVIFTCVIPFNLSSEIKYIESFVEIFTRQGAETYFIELEADLETRLKRNTHEFRLSQKASKQNISASEKNLIQDMKENRLNSLPGEIKWKNYIKINNNNISAADTASMIQKEFKL